MKKNQELFVALMVLSGACQNHTAASFPIATNTSVVEFTGGFATSGSNYLVGFFQNQTNPCVQLVSTNGSLIGSVLNIGESEGSPLIAAGKTNYLAFWASDNDSNGVDVFGQLISFNGGATGPAFPLLTNVMGLLGSQAESAIGFDGTNFMVVCSAVDESQNTGFGNFFGQLVAPSRTLLGTNFLMVSTLTNQQSDTHSALVFGTTNYLFVWEMPSNGPPGEWEVYGRFISKTGSAGTLFQISQTASLDYEPPAAAFDGTNFFVIMNTDTARTASGAPIWNIYGRLVSQSGSFPASELLLNTNQAVVGSLAFDGANYLLGWGFDTFTTNTDKSALFQFYNRSASAIGPAFVPISPRGTNYPVSFGTVFDGSKFVIAGTLGNLILSTNGSIKGLTSGAIYGAFIPASTASSTLTASNRIGTQFPLQLTGTPGIDYIIQMNTNIALPNWTLLVTNSPTNGTFSFTDTSATNKSRFYRAENQ